MTGHIRVGREGATTHFNMDRCGRWEERETCAAEMKSTRWMGELKLNSGDASVQLRGQLQRIWILHSLVFV
jgi:hypothetical protein